MCLFTSEKKPFIAKTDITVYKELIKDHMRSNIRKTFYKTPVQDYIVYPGTVMRPSNPSLGVVEANEKFKLGGGVIHSYTIPTGSIGDIVFKAIIPAGTEFWIQDDLCEVASKELFITNEKVTKTMSRKGDISWILDYVETLDVVTKDGLVTGIKDTKRKDIIGIMIDQKIMGIEMNNVKFYSEKIRNASNVFSPEDGYTNTINLSISDSPAAKWCQKHKTKGTRKGDWYIPSKNELLMVITNLLQVNVTLFVLEKDIIPLNDPIWCSTQDIKELRMGYFYSLSPLDGDCDYVHYAKRLCIPFLKGKPRGEEKGNYLKRLIMKCFQ